MQLGALLLRVLRVLQADLPIVAGVILAIILAVIFVLRGHIPASPEPVTPPIHAHLLPVIGPVPCTHLAAEPACPSAAAHPK